MRDTQKRYAADPAGAIADALQIARIPGTDDYLAQHFTGAQLVAFGNQVVHYLEIYGLGIKPLE